MSKKRIVIVEDERDMADLVARRLTREGYAVDVAPDGLTGLDQIRSRPTDLALVDIMLPHLSGTDLVKEVRQDPLTANVSIIMKTSKGEENDVVVEGERIVTQEQAGGAEEWRTLEVVYPIPRTLTAGKKQVTVTFRAGEKQYASRLLNCRMLKAATR